VTSGTGEKREKTYIQSGKGEHRRTVRGKTGFPCRTQVRREENSFAQREGKKERKQNPYTVRSNPSSKLRKVSLLGLRKEGRKGIQIGERALFLLSRGENSLEKATSSARMFDTKRREA